MIRNAILAGIPIISCTTSDTINVEQVLSHIVEAPCKKWATNLTGNKVLEENTVYYALPDFQPSIISKDLFDKLIGANSILILINRETPCNESFDVGELTVPKELMKELISAIVSGDDIEKLMRCVSGLTIKQMVEVIKVAQAVHGSTSPRAVMAVRSAIIGQTQGLKQVDTPDEFYSPAPELETWVKFNKVFFLESPSENLTPRGLILLGSPGVGKTQGAKYIAKSFDVPLYRLDLSSSLGKYVGESEANLSRVLSSVDQEEPCVLLIDEVEKIFKEKDDGGVTSRLLSQLLWWLQEHKSRVLVVMTTNNIHTLPPELYRAGRIDEQIEIKPLHANEIPSFVKQVLQNFKIESLDIAQIMFEIKKEVEDSIDQQFAHAEIVKRVNTKVKMHYSQTTKEGK